MFAAKFRKNGACGKTVQGMCTDVTLFAHFSLAPFLPIGDNPALSHSGGTRGRHSEGPRTGRQGKARRSGTGTIPEALKGK